MYLNPKRVQLYERVWQPLTAGQRRLLEPLLNGDTRVVWLCGRQVGKTELLARCTIEWLFQGKQLLWLAPTYDLTQIGFERVCERIRQIPLLGNLFRTRRSAPYAVRFDYSGGWCRFLTTANERQLQGYTLDAVIIDEAASVPELHYILDTYIAPMLAVRSGLLLLASTPRGMGDFADIARNDDYTTIHLTTFQGGLVSASYLERERERYRKRGADHLFAQEYLGEIIRTAGRFFPDPPLGSAPEWTRPPRRYVGVDWGYAAPLAAVLIETDGQRYYVTQCVYQARLTPEQQARALQPLCKHAVVLADPSTPDAVLDIWKQLGVYTKPASNDRVGGWNVIRDLLEQNRLIINPDCADLLYEWEDALYDPRKPDDLIAQSDHALDALRYALVEAYQPARPELPRTYQTLLMQQSKRRLTPRSARAR